MILLPNTLQIAADAIKKSGAEIINWRYFSFVPDNYLKPSGFGHLTDHLDSFSSNYKKYDPLKELKIKASGLLPRPSMSVESYVKGKICFGCYSKDLIARIINNSGALYGGATHDYSAMVQALILANKCIMLDEPGILFITLPANKSWGSLTALQASYALRYYNSFVDPESMLNSLLVPGLYASAHNMVAHDYVKYLKLYGKYKLFNENLWLRSIGTDLYLPNRVWTTVAEYQNQYNLFLRYISKNIRTRLYFYMRLYYELFLRFKNKLFLRVKLFLKNTILSFDGGQKLLDMRQNELDPTINQHLQLEAAVTLITSRYSTECLGSKNSIKKNNVY